MVYCGKASQGCQNCRTRRIKCDKVRPECSQCLRVHKKCPGYRDQLSLMFRDESTKVIQKAHASWGFDPNDSSRSSTSSPTSPASSSSGLSESPGPKTPTDMLYRTYGGNAGSMTTLSQGIGPTKFEQGVRFYLEHYVVGHPDEPRNTKELRQMSWLGAPGIQETMAAVGLAGLANLHHTDELHSLSRQHYGVALQHAFKALQNLQLTGVEQAARAVVMLAVFEVVKGTHEPSQGARIHIMGAASLIRSFAPWPQALAGGMRGLLQLCCSLVSSIQRSHRQASPEPEVLIPRQFIPCHVGGLAVPETFFDWVKVSLELVPAVDKPAAVLLAIITEFVQISAFVRHTLLVDGWVKTTNFVEQTLDLERRLDDWERGLDGIWLYKEIKVEDFPPETIFRGKYHAYTDMWTARIWNHYRWCRLLVNQMLLECASQFPMSSQGMNAEGRPKRCLSIIRRMAEDILTSIPTHWRHPRLNQKQRDILGTAQGGVGIGAAGLPSTLFQIKISANGPGIPEDHFDWGVRILDTVWSHMGMLQAKALADLMRAEREKQAARRSGSVSTVIIKQEPLDATAG